MTGQPQEENKGQLHIEIILLAKELVDLNIFGSLKSSLGKYHYTFLFLLILCFNIWLQLETGYFVRQPSVQTEHNCSLLKRAGTTMVILNQQH